MNKKLLPFLVLVFLVASCKKNDDPIKTETPPTPQEIATVINQTLAGKDTLSQFATAFKKLSLTEAEVKNGITLFAPSNNAYTLKTGSLRRAETPAEGYLPDSSIVKDYVISGLINTSTFTDGALLTALSGKKLTLSKKGNDWYLNDVYVNINSLSSDGSSVVFTLAGLLNSSVLPKVIGVSDTKTFPGWLLTVYGRNLSESITGNVVKIDDIAATVHSASPDSLIISVPKGITAGKLTVTTNGRTLSAPQDLTVQQAHVTTLNTGAASGFVQAITVDAADNIWWVENGASGKLFKYGTGQTTTYSPLFPKPGDTTKVPAFANSTLWSVAVSAENEIYLSSGRNGTRGYAGIFRTTTANPLLAEWWASSGTTSIDATTKDQLTIQNATAITTDQQGNVIFSNMGRIQQIAPNGTVTTLINSADFRAADAGAAASPMMYGILKVGDKLYMADGLSGRVWVKDASGLRVLAGNNTLIAKDGTGTDAQFAAPFGLAIDKKGNLYLCDNDYNTSNFLIRMINPKGEVTTIAGKVSQDDSDGTGSAAGFNGVNGIAIDSHGVLYVASDSGKIRKIEIN